MLSNKSWWIKFSDRSQVLIVTPQYLYLQLKVAISLSTNVQLFSLFVLYTERSLPKNQPTASLPSNKDQWILSKIVINPTATRWTTSSLSPGVDTTTEEVVFIMQYPAVWSTQQSCQSSRKVPSNGWNVTFLFFLLRYASDAVVKNNVICNVKYLLEE